MNDSLLISGARLITPDRAPAVGWLLCRDGRIDRLGYGETPDIAAAQHIDADGKNLIPGFIDIHVHGGAGHEAMDARQETLHALSAFYAAHGVTSFLATTWTDSRQRIEAALENIRLTMDQSLPGAQLLGAHLEGPYLNVEKCGAQNAAHIRPAARDEALAFLAYDVIRLVSLAPEIPGNQWLIRECVARGITVSAAHTSATYADMEQAVTLGVARTTHTYNAMTGLHHREPGTLGAALAFDALRCELIADTIHVHPGAIKVLHRAKGVSRVMLITDAIRAAGMPDGDYPIDDRVISVRGGVARLPDGTLAGSVLTFERGLKHYLTATGDTLGSSWPVSSLNAARAIGISAGKGSIEAGKDADIVLVDDDINVYMTICGGRIVYRSA